jgi:hypothetical protein
MTPERETELREFAGEPVHTEWRRDVRDLLDALDEVRDERDKVESLLKALIDSFGRFREILLDSAEKITPRRPATLHVLRGGKDEDE